ncbi:MAG TPA: MFS transporter [Caulobacteraceae bacterium]|jgi:MFS family permease
MATDQTTPQLSRRAFAIIFAVSMATAVGNTGLQSVLPAIGRSIGIPDPMVAAIFSLSAVLWAASSPFWARQSDIRGRKPMMLVGLAGFAISMTLCGLVVSAGLAKLAAPMTIFAFFLVSRAIFGFFGAASNPATQAYVAERTSPAERTQWMSNLAGSFSLGTVIGPVVAPIFIVGVFEFAGPLYAFALIAVVMLAVVIRYLKEEPVGAVAATGKRTTRPRQRLWRDRRLVPFIVYGFLLSTCQSALGQTLGFLIIDKTHKAFPELAPRALLHIAQGYIEVAMVAGAIAGLLALWGFIRMFSMTPKSLLRWGAGLAALGNLVVAFSPDYATATIGYGLASLGFSFARPGFTAGASLSVSMEDQAGAAGAIAAVNGVNIIIAPFAVIFYKMIPEGPFVIAAAVLAGLFAYAYLDPMLRNVGEGLGGEDLAIEATLERSDEGAGA